MSTDAAQAWSAAANSYADHVTQVTSEGGEALLELVESLRPFDKDSIVLDSGAGNGALTNLLVQKSSDMSITATDISPHMLSNLQSRSFPNVQTSILDASKDHTSQGLAASSYTHTLSTFLLQFLPSPQTTVQEMYSLLQPNGIIGLTIWSKTQIASPWDIACRNLDSKYLPNDAFSTAWSSCQDLEHGLKEAGFVDVQSREKELVMRFANAEAFVGYFLDGGNPALLMWQKSWKGERESVRGELTRVVREEFGDGRIEMVAASVVGRKA
ncbi:uncharacterized protein RCC_07507 [Ramularia collo-cygni]|uniref:Methyltransferase type 11 domain-containing protein n=1 Tax=Ramularia collo-cygni TaxID=112498 RepID=A0A2D3UVB1_9PEZI|nr:uncharacterized protein RCC_07507 [Ramularia collo-cygni]CZT21642.1 uncharacterized protein RCC_07507 [Ramularia collo-cygni]